MPETSCLHSRWIKCEWQMADGKYFLSCDGVAGKIDVVKKAKHKQSILKRLGHEGLFAPASQIQRQARKLRNGTGKLEVEVAFLKQDLARVKQDLALLKETVAQRNQDLARRSKQVFQQDQAQIPAP